MIGRRTLLEGPFRACTRRMLAWIRSRRGILPADLGSGEPREICASRTAARYVFIVGKEIFSSAGNTLKYSTAVFQRQGTGSRPKTGHRNHGIASFLSYRCGGWTLPEKELKRSLQVVESQSSSGLCNASPSCVGSGWGVDRPQAPETERKQRYCGTAHLPSVVFSTPGRCTQVRMNSNTASMKNRHRSTCIMLALRLERAARAAVTVWLSQRHVTVSCLHSGPHTAAAIMIGTSSFTAIGRALDLPSHGN